ncbi:hypothetical protein HK098_006238 [Nowakowskiella sp. JEL0407]|nr:hypothetical protein HK098_006238 [Nowakowskiella sp. JEL0407]
MDNDDSYTNNHSSSFPKPKRSGLKGGSDESLFLTTISNLSGMTSSALEDQALNFYSAAPITTIQVGAGLTLHVANMLGLIPNREILFHPRLIFSPYWQSYRAVTSFFVIGISTMDVLQRSLGSLYYQAPLETWFNGSGDLYRNGVLHHQGQQRKKIISNSPRPDNSSSSSSSNVTIRRKNTIEWLFLENPFFKSQLLTVATLLGIEFLLWESQPLFDAFNPFQSYDINLLGTPSSYLIFPYTLFPNLEYATRWTWALTTQEREVIMFGVLPVKPVYLPIVLCGMGGFQQFPALIKGFFASLVVSKAMQLKRFDGEFVAEWTIRLCMDWYYWVKGMVDNAVKTNAKGKGKARGVGSSSTSQQSSGSGSRIKRASYDGVKVDEQNDVDLMDPDFYRPYMVNLHLATGSGSNL